MNSHSIPIIDRRFHSIAMVGILFAYTKPPREDRPTAFRRILCDALQELQRQSPAPASLAGADGSVETDPRGRSAQDSYGDCRYVAEICWGYVGMICWDGLGG